MTNVTRKTFLSISAIAALALTACGNTAAQTPPADHSGHALTAHDVWTKAAESGMTSAFGTIKNTTDKDIVVASASSLAAKSTELHETIMDANGNMKMQPRVGGFTVPAHGELLLEPGAGHLMLMDLTGPILAGDSITITLKLGDGGTFDLTAQAKDFAGAKEDYKDISGHEGMDHGTESPAHK